MFEAGTSLLYLPKNIEKVQIKSFVNYIEENFTFGKKFLLKFFIMKCMEKNDDYKKFRGIKREKTGIIKHIDGKAINEEVAMNYDEFIGYLSNEENMVKENKLK